MESPECSNYVTGERTRTSDGRGWRWRMDVLAATMIVAAVLPTACTANGPPSSSSTGGSTVVQKALAFARCMRSHGAPSWPDPNSQGTFMVDPATNAKFKAPFSARQACHHLLPHGASKPVTRQEAAAMLKFAECMRSHGAPGFPNPLPGGGFTMAGANVSPNAPQFKHASQVCTKIAPW